MTSTRYGIALVLVGEDLGPGLLRGLGPRESDLWTVAHESVHLIGQRVSKDYVKHPEWVREGIAEAVAHEVMVIRAGRDGSPPIAQTRDAAAYSAMRNARGSGLGQLLEGNPPGRGVFEQYATQGSFVQFLREPDRVDRFERALLVTLEDPLAFEQTLAGYLELENLRELTAAFQQFLIDKRPEWSLGPGHLEREGRNGWLQVGLGNRRAWAWHLQQRPPGPWHQRVRWRQDPLGAGASAWIAIQRRSGDPDASGWSETITALELPPGGVPRLVEIHHGSGQPALGELRVLAEAMLRDAIDPTLDLHEAEIAWRDGQVILKLNGQEALGASVASDGLAGEWGLGVDPGGVVRWQLN